MGTALPKPGELIVGKYRIERTLGSGGMGAVFEVRHAVTHKRFALKWLLPEIADRPDSLKRFTREAQVAGRFKHPNVIDVYDICQAEAGVFMVMELLEGESLAERVRRETRLSVGDACRILAACLDGVGAAHHVGIVHRDIKPANIFLCRACGREPEQPKVLDFGISRLMNAAPTADGIPTTLSGAMFGTPYYMAPEQMSSQPCDHRVDIYALGVMLYELLCGQRPFDAESYPQLVLHIAYGEPKPLRDLAPDVPSALAAIVARAMNKSPAARYATVAEFAQALAPYTLVSVSAPTVAASEPAWASVITTDAESDLVKSDSNRDRRRRVKSLSIWMVTAAAAFAFGILTARRMSSSPTPLANDSSVRSDLSSDRTVAPNTPTFGPPAASLVPSAFPPEATRPTEHVEPATPETPAPATHVASTREHTPTALARHKHGKAVVDHARTMLLSPPSAAREASESLPPSAAPASEATLDNTADVPRHPILDLDRAGF